MAAQEKTKAQLLEENERLRAELDAMRLQASAPAGTRDSLREERYRAILSDIEYGFYEVDLAGNITFCNASMCGMLGYKTSEIMGMNYRAFMDGEAKRGSSRSSTVCTEAANPKRISITNASARMAPVSPSRCRSR